MASKPRVTGVITSITSAVPAGEVIARDEVFGMTKPALAQIATTMGVVRLPGRPPTQCLSAMGLTPQLNRSPMATMAAVRSITS